MDPAHGTKGTYYALAFAVFHVFALLATVPWFFSWIGVLVMLITTKVSGTFGIVIGYHRLLSHRSFAVPRWLEHILVTCAMCSLQETPARWVAWHRAHHRHSDKDADPHTPRAGIAWAHVLWLVRGAGTRGEPWPTPESYARDILRDPFYAWIERTPLAPPMFFLAHAVIIAGAAAGVFLALYGPTAEALRLTLSVVVWGLVVRTVVVWHLTWSVNSLTHVFGYRNFHTPDDSRNNWLVAMLTGGEGWHNNHHADPTSATVRVRWWEYDSTYAFISLLARLGLATDVVPLRHVRDACGRADRPGATGA